MAAEESSLESLLTEMRKSLRQFLTFKMGSPESCPVDLTDEDLDFTRRYGLGGQPIVTNLDDDGLWLEEDRAGYKLMFNHLLQSDWSFTNRTEFVDLFSWAIPSLKALGVLARYGPLVELGAGSGFWAYLLRNSGVDILSFDEFEFRSVYPFNRQWLPVQEGGLEQLAKYPDRTLFLCWPPIEDMATRALQAYTGRYVAYIGEGQGGCTADATFFEEIEKGWHEVECCSIPKWSAIHDYLWVYERKSKYYGIR